MMNDKENCLKILNLFIILMIYITISISNSYAQKKTYGEYEVKAAFIYNFLKFIEFPDSSSDNSTVNLCILGDDPFGKALSPVQSDGERDKKIIVKRYNNFTGQERCQILFICRSEKRHLSQLLNTIKGMSILTIGDTEDFAKQGVIINFYIEEDKVRFEINKEAADKAGLKISSRLLSLARIIHGEER